jgi:Protein of unknown function (DUF4058)
MAARGTHRAGKERPTMPSPFPGMDPYLEAPDIWPGFHTGFITFTRTALNHLLPSGYVADMGERLYVVQSGRGIYPDLALWEARRSPPAASEQSETPPLVDSRPRWVIPVAEEAVREVFIQIVSPPRFGRTVTVIEMLTPANKAAGSDGRQQYQAKQAELLGSETHLIEIDCLRRGEHTVAAPRARLDELGTWDYLVCLHRAARPERYEIWPIHLRERLPVIRIPLSGDDPDVELDLQPIFDRSYDEAPYQRILDYGAEPVPPLALSDSEWAHALLHERRSPER